MHDPTRETLEQQLQEALKELEQLEQRLQQKADYGPGKGDPAIYEWEFTLALREQARAKVDTSRRALQRLHEGRYGTCERCGTRINPERLSIVPLATLCNKCARAERR